MKITKTERTIIEEDKEYPGLLECALQHEIKSTSAEAAYTGPYIPPEVWESVLAFFKHVNDSSHSECQVRMFVNPDQQIWDMWAFPQEAQTGMSARELDTEETKTQRARYSDADGWIYFGTAHHHCNGSAFQSSTDESNEKNQDGLHITVGKMNDARAYDIHCRFYIASLKLCFEPDMSEFWDIGTNLRQLTPRDLHDRIARHQMTVPPKAETIFPDQWKDNLIVKKEAVSIPYQNNGGGLAHDYHNKWSDNSQLSFYVRVERCADQLHKAYLAHGLLGSDLFEDIKVLEEHFDPVKGQFRLLRAAMLNWKLNVDDFYQIRREAELLKSKGWKRDGVLKVEGGTKKKKDKEEVNEVGLSEDLQKEIDDWEKGRYLGGMD